MNCIHMESLIYPMTEMLLFLGTFSTETLEDACQYFDVDQNKIVTTRCGWTSSSFEHLLGARNEKLTHSFLPNKMYKVVLSGLSRNEYTSYFDHVFHLLQIDGEWLMFDSYIACRPASCLPVNIDELVSQLDSLSTAFNSKLWATVTGCSIMSKHFAHHVRVNITESDYDLNYIDERFWLTIDQARTKLHAGAILESPSSLQSKTAKDRDNYLDSLPLLHGSKTVKEAGDYLDSLMKLIPNRSWLKKSKLLLNI